MLELVCYLLAVILAGLAAAVPNGAAPFDRVRFLAAGFVAFAIPALVHAGQHM